MASTKSRSTTAKKAKGKPRANAKAKASPTASTGRHSKAAKAASTASKRGAKSAAASAGIASKSPAARRAAAPRVRLGFLGGGNMAEAMVKGLIAAGNAPASILVAEPDAARRRLLAKRYGVGVTADNAEVQASASTIVLAVKPQVLGEVLAALAPAVTGRELFVSIAAGVMLARIEQVLGPRARVVRVMPNTPCLLGQGASVLCAGSRATRADAKLVKSLFAAVGDAHEVTDEKQMHAVTALSGSGPAYVYRFAEALVDGAARAGLPEDLARALTYRTIAGAAAMMIQTGQDPADLRRAVSSPGGTTLAGLGAMEERGFPESVRAALQAAARRSVELGKA